MNVAVLGATGHGQAVAQLSTVAGHTVRLYDSDANVAMDGVDAVERRLAEENDASLDRLSATTGLEGAVSDVDIVVETTAVDAGTLQERFAEIESHTDRETLVVPSATGVSVTAAAAGLRRPGRAVGLQFRDPPDGSLVEVVVADQTTQSALDGARSFVESLDRWPVVVRDGPGVGATRLELALESEAMRLVSDGLAGVESVDAILEVGYDHPVGPLERADRAGLSGRLETFEFLHAEVGERFEPPDILRELVASGKTGAPSGEGFYVWENGDPIESALPDPGHPSRDHRPDDPALE